MHKKKTYVPMPEVAPEMRERFATMMAVLSGEMSVKAAAKKLGMSRNHFQTLLHRGMRGFLEEMSPKKAGRPPTPAREASLSQENEKLRRQNEALLERVETTDRMLGIAGGLLRGQIKPRGRTSATRPVKSKATDQKPEEPDGAARRSLEAATEMKQLGLKTMLAANAVGKSTATLRRWTSRLRRGEPLCSWRGPQKQGAPESGGAHGAALVEHHVRELHGLVGAASLAKTVAGFSRRRCAAIKRETLMAMERERVASAERVTVTTPGVLRGFDQMHVATTDGPRVLLFSGDGAVLFPQSVVQGGLLQPVAPQPPGLFAAGPCCGCPGETQSTPPVQIDLTKTARDADDEAQADARGTSTISDVSDHSGDTPTGVPVDRSSIITKIGDVPVSRTPSTQTQPSSTGAQPEYQPGSQPLPTEHQAFQPANEEMAPTATPPSSPAPAPPRNTTPDVISSASVQTPTAPTPQPVAPPTPTSATPASPVQLSWPALVIPPPVVTPSTAVPSTASTPPSPPSRQPAGVASPAAVGTPPGAESKPEQGPQAAAAAAGKQTVAANNTDQRRRQDIGSKVDKRRAAADPLPLAVPRQTSTVEVGQNVNDALGSFSSTPPPSTPEPVGGGYPSGPMAGPSGANPLAPIEALLPTFGVYGGGRGQRSVGHRGIRHGGIL